MSQFDSAWVLKMEARGLLTRDAGKRGAGRPSVDEAPMSERRLHELIEAHCRAQGWLAIHSRMDWETTLAKGVPDFVIYADRGRVITIECKSRIGKLRPEQAAWHRMAELNGHKVHVVRSFQEFLEVVR